MESGDADESDVAVAPGATVGVAYADDTSPPRLGPGSVVRRGTIIYDDVVAGRDLTTGHNALIREDTRLGDGVLVGTVAVVDGAATVGDRTSMQTGAYVPRETELGDRVFLGPNATLLNDRYPVRSAGELEGPTVEDDVTVGANATVLPGVTLGAGSFVGAGALVTDDVPPGRLAVGAPATVHDLPDHLEGGNDL